MTPCSSIGTESKPWTPPFLMVTLLVGSLAAKHAYLRPEMGTFVLQATTGSLSESERPLSGSPTGGFGHRAVIRPD